MGVLADLVPYSHPALGRFPEAAATDATWRWPFEGWTDSAGDGIDFSGCTGECKLLTYAYPYTEVATLTFTGYEGGAFVVELDEAATSTLNADLADRPLRWFLTISDGTDTIHWWLAAESPFTIYDKS